MTLVALLACSGTDGSGTVPDAADSDTTVDTGSTTGRETTLQASLGPVATLSDPPSGGYHHHATLALGPNDYVVAWTSGFDPVTHAWAQRFDEDGVPLTAPQQLSDAHPAGQKPDVVRVVDGWLTAYDDHQGGIWLRSLGADGSPVGPSSLLVQTPAPTEADAVDLAVQPDGSGIAIWTEFGAVGMDPDDGRIVWRAFDSDGQGDGTPQVAEASSKKASDAAPLAGGGFVAVWAIHDTHPTLPDEVAYEVRGSTFGVDEPVTFRADDLEAAWPSRPAVAVGPEGRLAVSWRDKTASRGDPAGAYGRLFGADAAALGPSVELSPGGDGDRVVTTWAGSYAVFAWQETGSDGLAAVWLSVVDVDGRVLVDRLEVSEPGGDHDERPSIDVRGVHGAYEVVVIWETVIPQSSSGDGLRARVVTLEPVLAPG